MTIVGGGVRGLVARAQREAQRRGQAPSTAHLLLVLLQSGGPSAVLMTQLGLRETELLNAIRVVEGESGSAIERAVERAYRLAKSLGDDEVMPAHLLLALARDSRSAAHRSLEQLGMAPNIVQQALVKDWGWSNPPAGMSQAPAPSTKQPARTSPQRMTQQRAPNPLPRLRNKKGAPEMPPPAMESEPGLENFEPQAAAASPKRPNIRVLPEPREMVMPTGALNPLEFPTLTGIGRNLTVLACEGKIDPVIGRDEEIDQILDVLSRRRANNPIVIGPPGVGKTAIVEGLAARLAAGGQGVRGLESRIIVEVSAGGLVSGTGVRGALAERIKQISEEVRRSDGRVVLFIDEIHAIFGAGESPDDLSHELKALLSRGELPCVGATTEAEYRKHFERDPALARRFSPVHVREPSPEDARQILFGITPKYEVHHGVSYDDDAINAAVEFSIRYIPTRMLPDKAIALVDLAGARVRRRGGDAVTRESIAAVVAEQARVPLERLLQRDSEKLLGLEKLLQEKVVGHAASMLRIADALRKGAAGFYRGRPMATFLFLGPTGVGKTETAKALSDIFFPGCPMTRLDMSEFAEPHAVARLLGAPPGYVGHEEGGQLTEAVRHRPYQLILLDEIEKAHIDVIGALLPLLDEGRLTDSKGRTVDFTNTIIVMTSNLGGDKAGKPAGIGFSNAKEQARHEEQALESARRALPPEVWNRIDEPLFFGTLSRKEVKEIARRLVAEFGRKLSDAHEMRLEIDDSAIELMVNEGGYDAALGARPMRRVVGRMLEAQLATAILAQEFTRGDGILIRAEDGKLVIERQLPELQQIAN